MNRAVFPMFSAAMLAACAHHSTSMPVSQPSARAPEQVQPLVLEDGCDVPEPSLRDAMEDNVGIPDMGPAMVVQSWTWRPRGTTPFVVWVTCRGEAEMRLCSMAAAPVSAGFV